MRKSIAILSAGIFAAAASMPAMAQSKADTELDQASEVLQSLTGPQSNAGIPDAVLKDAKCVAVIPKMVKGGFVLGAEHGDGVATCKTAEGKWSPPAPFQMSGASFGAQIGGEEQGYVMMIMNDQGMQALNSGHFKVGAGVNAAAGPVGRNDSELRAFEGRLCGRNAERSGAEPGPRQDEEPVRTRGGVLADPERQRTHAGSERCEGLCADGEPGVAEGEPVTEPVACSRQGLARCGALCFLGRAQGAGYRMCPAPTVAEVRSGAAGGTRFETVLSRKGNGNFARSTFVRGKDRN